MVFNHIHNNINALENKHEDETNGKDIDKITIGTSEMLGKDAEDVRWISQCLLGAGVMKDEFTEYDGSHEIEEELQDFFTSHNQVLLTTADLFDGMESPTIVYAYNDPYPWPRRTFLRAIQNLILLDRNVQKETDQDRIKQTVLESRRGQ